MGQRAPAPRLLRLKPEDSRVVKGAHLAKGKFTWITESGKQERWIVVSCGNYTVLWNFRSGFALLSLLHNCKCLSHATVLESISLPTLHLKAHQCG